MKNFKLGKLVKDRRLTVNERLSGRLGYMGKQNYSFYNDRTLYIKLWQYRSY